MKLLRMLILRPLRRDLLRTVLTVLAVALGVAVVRPLNWQATPLRVPSALRFRRW